MPSMQTIGVKTLGKIRDFFKAGGQVVAVGRLPTHSAEPGMDEQVQQLLLEIFGDRTREDFNFETVPRKSTIYYHLPSGKGKAFYIQTGVGTPADFSKLFPPEFFE